MDDNEKARRKAARSAARRISTQKGKDAVSTTAAAAVESLAVVEGIPEMSVSSLQSAGVKMEVTKEDLLAILMEDGLDKLRDQIKTLEKAAAAKHLEYAKASKIGLDDFPDVAKFVKEFCTRYKAAKPAEQEWSNFRRVVLHGTSGPFSIAMTLDIQGQSAEAVALNKELAATGEEIAELQRKIQFIDRNPAKFRAQVSKLMLSATQEGRKLINAMRLVKIQR